MSVIAPVPSVLSAVLLLSVVCCSPARADWCHGGEVPSIEWLVDASNVVAAEVVEVPGGYNTYRVTEILKRSKSFTSKEGDVIDGKPLWLLTRDGWKHRDPIVMFLGNDTSVARAVVNLIRPQNVWGKPEKTYLAVDKHGKRVPDRDDFMRRVRERIEKLDGSNSGFLPIREAGFEYFPKYTEIDDHSQFFSLHVPPDPCFREMLEKAAEEYAVQARTGSCVWGQATLFQFYLGYTDERKKEHRKKTIRDACDFARTLQLRDETLFDVTNYCTYHGPHTWLGRVSPNGRYLALLTGDGVEVQDLVSGGAVSTNDASYVHSCRAESMVFSADNKHLAHVQADGDVTLIDLMRLKIEHTFKFGWTPHPKMRIWRFMFSPDGRYLVLQMSVLQGAFGSALQIWDIESGKTVFKPNDDWNTRFSVEGFCRGSSLVKVQAVEHNSRTEEEVARVRVWDLDNGRFTDEPAAGEWLMHVSPNSSRLLLERESGRASLRAETRDGRLQAEVVPGTPQRLVIREADSQKVVRTVELSGLKPVGDVYFSGSGEAVILVFFRHDARMFRIAADKPWPTWFGVRSVWP
ncbi:MAG: hypothetical protein KJ000_20165 [Pirellulaceae bacterium]|nr:hypothetical protein [Pirellulaceae bacterium]